MSEIARLCLTLWYNGLAHPPRISAVLLPIQLPADASEKAAGDGPSLWAP